MLALSIHDPGTPDPGTPDPAPDRTADLRARLARVATDLDTRFNQASERLADAVDAIDQIVGALQAMAGEAEQRTAAAAVDDLTRAAARLSAVPAQVASRGGHIASIRAASTTLQGNLAEVQKCLQVLQIYAMNVKIASGGAADFVDFAERMDGKLKAGVAEGKALDATLGALEASVRQIQQVDGLLAAESARVVPEVPAQLTGDAAALRTHQAGLAELAQAIGAMARSIQAALGSALGAIQVGDRARQRLEHVVTGCALLETALADPALDATECGAVRHHMLGLFGALTAAARNEYHTELTALLGSMGRLEANAGELIALRGRDAGHGAEADSGVFLRRVEGGIARAGNMVAELHRAGVQADATLGVIHRTVNEVSSRAATIRDLRIDVRQMAINIALRCRRVEAIGRPVTVIANEIRTYSDRLDGVIDQIIAGEDDLTATSLAMREQGQDRSRSGENDLSGSLDAIRNSADQAERAMAAVEERSGGVLDMLGQATMLLEQCLEYGGIMDATAAQLVSDAHEAGAIGDDALLRLLLDEVARSYSMADERLVHNAYLLPGMPPLGTDAPQLASSDDDDDSLFDDALF